MITDTHGRTAAAERERAYAGALAAPISIEAATTYAQSCSLCVHIMAKYLYYSSGRFSVHWVLRKLKVREVKGQYRERLHEGGPESGRCGNNVSS